MTHLLALNIKLTDTLGAQEHVIDAVNETLRDLAEIGRIDDANDDGWMWMDVIPDEPPDEAEFQAGAEAERQAERLREGWGD